MGIVSKVVLILGIFGVVLGIAIAAISAALVPLTDGRTSWDEAMFGIIPGVVILVISFFVLALGIVLVMIAKKKNNQI